VVRFQYDLDSPAPVTLKIYDFSMALVKTVVDGIHRSQGDRFEEWDGRNDRNDLVANGTYFYLLKAGDRDHWGKVVILD
jgi:flagellar hook assembly protein FlgD